MLLFFNLYAQYALLFRLPLESRGWKRLENAGRGWNMMEEAERDWKRLEEAGRDSKVHLPLNIKANTNHRL